MMMDGDGDAREPHLKYESLGGDVAGITSSGDEISCLCLSDKILAIGTVKGRVHVLRPGLLWEPGADALGI